MNKQSKSLGKSSTKTASLSNAVSSIKQSINPVITTRSTRAHPRCIKAATEQWHNRTVRFYKSQPVTARTVSLTYADISVFSGIVANYSRIRALRVKVWNITNQTRTTNMVFVTVPAAVTESNLGVSAEDVGTASSLPGVEVILPRTLSADFAGNNGQVLVDISSKFQTGTPGDAQEYAIDVQFEWKTTTQA